MRSRFQRAQDNAIGATRSTFQINAVGNASTFSTRRGQRVYLSETCFCSRRHGAGSVKRGDGATDFADLLHFNCCGRSRMDGALINAESHRFAYSAAGG